MEDMPIESNGTVPDSILRSWQNIVDTLAVVMEVPSALIVKAGASVVEVVCAHASKGNPWKVGGPSSLSGLFIEPVFSSKHPLSISNAASDNRWKKASQKEHGMVAFLGHPLLRPDGSVYGALCVFDKKPRHYTSGQAGMMAAFRELIEAHLATLEGNTQELEGLQEVLDNLAEGIIAHDPDRRISFFNRAAEIITGYSRQEVLGKDCHTVFGGPLCGNRCAFQQGAPESLGSRYYPLNIFTKDGEPRRIEMAIGGRKDRLGRQSGVIASFRDVTDILGMKIQLGELTGFAGLVGRNRKMLQVYSQIRELSTSDYPVHLFGETGTGKELAALAIHNESRRGGGPFVPVNCAALPEGVLESELFGHTKGAFTGAVRDKKGRFELAHRGTLFFDEIADLPASIQAKLLRVLQEGTFERVGDEKTTTVDVRILSATNKNLKQEVEKGRFRQDLFYRINVVPISIPPLRERRDDIALLVEHFLGLAREEGQFPPTLSKEALKTLAAYTWPGNVRELQSALRFAMVKAKGRIIGPEHLPLELRQWQQQRPTRGPAKKLNLEAVRDALGKTGGNKAKAARILGVGRATLYRFLATPPGVS